MRKIPDLFYRGINTITREIENSVHREISYYRKTPSAALLILTYRCTSRCKTCTIWQRPKEGIKELGLADWKRIIEQLYRNNVREMELFGGDVFLRKDLLMPLIRFMKDKGMIIHLPTNGNLLTWEIAEELVKGGVDYIYLSVDAVGEEQDNIRGVSGTFDRVARAARFLVKARDTKEKPRLVCNTTVSKLNIDSLEKIPEFALNAGFDENHFEYVGEFNDEHVKQSVIDGITPTPYYMQQGDSVLLTDKDAIRLKDILWRIRKRYAHTDLGILTVNIDSLSVKDIFQGTINNKRCYVLRTEVTVDPYGNVIPCMSFNNYFLGNLIESDFEDIWNGPKHRRFIEHQKTGNLGLCKHCILGVQRNHNFYTSLKRIYYTHMLNWYFSYILRP